MGKILQAYDATPIEELAMRFALIFPYEDIWACPDDLSPELFAESGSLLARIYHKAKGDNYTVKTQIQSARDILRMMGDETLKSTTSSLHNSRGDYKGTTF